MKKIAIVGSSGGNLYSQGGNNPEQMMKEVFTQAGSVDIEVGFIQFVGTGSSMDNVSQNAKARLYTLGEGTNLNISDEDTLENINILAREQDEKLATLINEGEIDAMMLLSCDPKGVNEKAIAAAAAKQIPIAGTGGTSMSLVQTAGCNVVAVSGTTGTTNRTRAISAIAAFSKVWGIKYSPVIGNTGSSAAVEGSVWKRISMRGIMMASMPGFIAMAVVLALGNIPGLSIFSGCFDILVGILPIIVAAIAAKQVSGLSEVGIVAGVVAGALSTNGGIIGGILAGILAGIFVHYISNFCFKHNVPGTTTNIAAGGLGGLAAGLIGMFIIAPIALFIGDGIKFAIDWALTYNAVLAGLIAGFAIWFAIIGGVYHAAILPIVLLEMENTGFSFLGAIDLCGLVMVCAGIQLAYIIKPTREGERTAAIPSILVNLGFGTFVEAAYPFMFSSKKVFASAIAASSLSGIFVGLWNVKCTAYVPCFVAPFVSNDNILFTILSMAIALGSACIFTLLANIGSGKAKKAKSEADTPTA